jgi:hypothetical protein
MKNLAVIALAAFTLCASAVILVLLVPDISWAAVLEVLTYDREGPCSLSPSNY